MLTDFNAGRSNNLQTSGVDATSNGLGIELIDIQTIDDVRSLIANVREAREELRNFGRTFASDLSILTTRTQFAEQTVNTLNSGSDDLVVTDQNENGANLLALQTRQQIQFSILSLTQRSIADFL